MANDSLTVGLDPPSSPNLTTCNNFFFLTLRLAMNQKRFQNTHSLNLYSSKHRMSTHASNCSAAYGHTVPRCKKTTLKGTVWNRRQMQIINERKIQSWNFLITPHKCCTLILVPRNNNNTTWLCTSINVMFSNHVVTSKLTL